LLSLGAVLQKLGNLSRGFLLLLGAGQQKSVNLSRGFLLPLGAVQQKLRDEKAVFLVELHSFWRFFISLSRNRLVLSLRSFPLLIL
jgi:hypothetical protein